MEDWEEFVAKAREILAETSNDSLDILIMGGMLFDIYGQRWKALLQQEVMFRDQARDVAAAIASLEAEANGGA